MVISVLYFRDFLLKNNSQHTLWYVSSWKHNALLGRYLVLYFFFVQRTIIQACSVSICMCRVVVLLFCFLLKNTQLICHGNPNFKIFNLEDFFKIVLNIFTKNELLFILTWFIIPFPNFILKEFYDRQLNLIKTHWSVYFRQRYIKRIYAHFRVEK